METKEKTLEEIFGVESSEVCALAQYNAARGEIYIEGIFENENDAKKEMSKWPYGWDEDGDTDYRILDIYLMRKEIERTEFYPAERRLTAAEFLAARGSFLFTKKEKDYLGIEDEDEDEEDEE